MGEMILRLVTSNAATKESETAGSCGASSVPNSARITTLRVSFLSWENNAIVLGACQLSRTSAIVSVMIRQMGSSRLCWKTG